MPSAANTDSPVASPRCAHVVPALRLTALPPTTAPAATLATGVPGVTTAIMMRVTDSAQASASAARRPGAMPRQTSSAADHVLHLRLRGVTLPTAARLICNAVYSGNRERMVDAGEDGSAARLAEFERRVGVDGHEDFSIAITVGWVGADDLGNTVIDGLQAHGQAVLGDAHAAAGDIGQRAVTQNLNHAEAGDAGARIDAEHAHQALPRSAAGGLKISVRVDMLDVIQVFQGFEQF